MTKLLRLLLVAGQFTPDALLQNCASGPKSGPR